MSLHRAMVLAGLVLGLGACKTNGGEASAAAPLAIQIVKVCPDGTTVKSDAICPAVAVPPPTAVASSSPPTPPANTAVVAAAGTPFGVNIGCGSCGSGTRLWTDYTYGTTGQIDQVYDQGVRTVRLGVQATRIVTTPSGAVDPNVAGALHPLIDHALAKGMTVILDVHDYGKWFGNTLVENDIGAVRDMWERGFGKYKGNARFMPSFMNEPIHSGATIWTLDQRWIDAMRSAGWTQTLVLPGQDWSPLTGYAGRFGAQALALKDPRDNLLFDGHIYWDYDSSGTHTDVLGLTDADLADGSTLAQKVRDRFYAQVRPSLAWARTNGKKFLIGETALPNTPLGRAVAKTMVQLWAENSDVVAQQTWWVYAEWVQSPGYIFGLMQDGQPSPLFVDIAKARTVP